MFITKLFSILSSSQTHNSSRVKERLNPVKTSTEDQYLFNLQFDSLALIFITYSTLYDSNQMITALKWQNMKDDPIKCGCNLFQFVYFIPSVSYCLVSIGILVILAWCLLQTRPLLSPSSFSATDFCTFLVLTTFFNSKQWSCFSLHWCRLTSILCYFPFYSLFFIVIIITQIKYL